MAWAILDQERVGRLAYELELPEWSGYKFHPVVHLSFKETSEQPTTTLVADLDDTNRFDLDEELLPEDGWIPYGESG